MFTAARPFPIEEAEAWFLCMDAVELVDRELRAVDQLMQELGRPRLQANRVLGAKDYGGLCECIPTSGWLPVDTRLRVSDVSALVQKLGGSALYGPQRQAALRELIQNGVDAVRARRLFEQRPASWGEVTVRTGHDDEEGYWIEVQDTGVGMSERVLTGPLLDFGRSYWSSSLFREEMPGLIAAGFDPIGQFGIGFFAVFMLGSKVRIITRRCDAAKSDTRVLEFHDSANLRPILRPAAPHEQLVDGGTVVRAWVREDPAAPDAILADDYTGNWSFETELARLCPALNVDLSLDVDGTSQPVVYANDWKRMSAEELLKRIWGLRDLATVTKTSEERLRLLNGLAEITDEHGEIVGRAAIYRPSRGTVLTRQRAVGCVTVGGLTAAELYGIQGIFTGSPIRAARDLALPVVSPERLSKWASEQAKQPAWFDMSITDLADTVWACGAETLDLPIAESQAGMLNCSQLVEWAKERDHVLLVPESEVWGLRNDITDPKIEWDANVLISSNTFIGQVALRSGRYYGAHAIWPSWPERDSGVKPYLRGTLYELCLMKIAEAWQTSVRRLLNDIVEYRCDDPGESPPPDTPAIAMLFGEEYRATELTKVNRPSTSGEPSPIEAERAPFPAIAS